jgi:hypothetical protein
VVKPGGVFEQGAQEAGVLEALGEGEDLFEAVVELGGVGVVDELVELFFGLEGQQEGEVGPVDRDEGDEEDGDFDGHDPGALELRGVERGGGPVGGAGVDEAPARQEEAGVAVLGVEEQGVAVVLGEVDEEVAGVGCEPLEEGLDVRLEAVGVVGEAVEDDLGLRGGERPLLGDLRQARGGLALEQGEELGGGLLRAGVHEGRPWARSPSRGRRARPCWGHPRRQVLGRGGRQ